MGLQKIMKATPSKALVVKINLVFLTLFLVVYATLRPSSSLFHENAKSVVPACSLHERHHHHHKDFKRNTVLEIRSNISRTKVEKPRFMDQMGSGMKIGMIMDEQEDGDLSEWKLHGEIIIVNFDKVTENFKWEYLFPEWIDEEEETDVPSCPEIPMPDFNSYTNMDMVVVKLPCKHPKEGWNRDVFRLQVHLIVANLAAKKAKRDSETKSKVVIWSKCRPMLEFFRCEDLVIREGDWWLYLPDMTRLDQKVSMPVGSCQLALPLWGQGIDEVYDLSRIKSRTNTVKREAYATVLHSSEAYVCGAITLAQSLIQTGTKRDLILLLDSSISESKRDALTLAGWKLRFIKRIRNPKAEKGTYNEYNYSKFRLWQLTDYDKVIFIDADIIVLRNLDLIFHFPQISATGNDFSIFNSGIMVIEPSRCTFRILKELRNEILSYNGGDQGFFNEVYVWWHRLPRRVNFLKNFWSNSSTETSMKNHLFGADPPKVYAIHYLGLKPWLCYRDYDCNWDIVDQQVYASDVAHKRWWKVYDAMDKRLHEFCRLTKQRKVELNWEKRKARKKELPDQHWKINITDPRARKSLLV